MAQPGFNPFINDNDPRHPWGQNFDFDSAKGIFWFGGDDWPGTLGIHLEQTDGVVVYFTRPMLFNASPLGLSLMMQYLVDDGAVFYMNGTEFLRVGLPAGPISTNTTATKAAYPPSWVGPVAFNQAQLLFGTNNFAVELHTATALDTNMGFAARLSADISS